MKKSSLFSLIIGFLLFSTSCNQDDDDNPTPSQNPQTGLLNRTITHEGNIREYAFTF